MTKILTAALVALTLVAAAAPSYALDYTMIPSTVSEK